MKILLLSFLVFGSFNLLLARSLYDNFYFDYESSKDSEERLFEMHSDFEEGLSDTLSSVFEILFDTEESTESNEKAFNKNSGVYNDYIEKEFMFGTSKSSEELDSEETSKHNKSNKNENEKDNNNNNNKDEEKENKNSEETLVKITNHHTIYEKDNEIIDLKKSSEENKNDDDDSEQNLKILLYLILRPNAFSTVEDMKNIDEYFINMNSNDDEISKKTDIDDSYVPTYKPDSDEDDKSEDDDSKSDNNNSDEIKDTDSTTPNNSSEEDIEYVFHFVKDVTDKEIDLNAQKYEITDTTTSSPELKPKRSYEPDNFSSSISSEQKTIKEYVELRQNLDNEQDTWETNKLNLDKDFYTIISNSKNEENINKFEKDLFLVQENWDRIKQKVNAIQNIKSKLYLHKLLDDTLRNYRNKSL